MREIILCKYGELVLKGLNKKTFESILLSKVKAAIAGLGEFSIYYSQSVMYVDPIDDNCDFEEAFKRICRVFGFVSIIRAAKAEKTVEDILAVASEYLPDFLYGKKTFKVEGKRSDKRFPMTSPEISGEIGGVLLDKIPGLSVDLVNPEITVRVEIREKYAYLHAGGVKGAGGIPYGSSGKALLLLSGGIDSPVAGYMMARRGAVVDCLHFESFPYTSERAKEKVLELAKKVAKYTGNLRVRVISLTKIQEEIRDRADEDYFTLLLRRSMMRLAEKVARDHFCDAIITGESLGQVASQTMKAITVTDCAVDMPVFRPLIGMDKEEIIAIARRIDTFETSILPYEDCCTVFTPKHPRTRPELAKVLVEEAKVDFETLEKEALESIEYHDIKGYDD
ncbi:MAG: tRNA 4-thiouridine(8) synthase ThiI [Clostridia bacterium]|nr:tRNA 4-thiouridine(8) synthase ThiI [Clostridia bacterium]